MKQKRGISDLLIVLIVAVLFVSASSYFFIRDKLNKKPQDNKIDKNINEKIPQNNPSKQNKIERNNPEKTNKKNKGGGGGSGGGESPPNSENSCTEKQISYSLITVYKLSNCTQFEGNICTKKWVNCSTKIKNDDSETSGKFVVELVFLKKGGDTQTDGFDKKNFTYELKPGELEEMKGSTIIESSGEDGLANKEINCFYHTLEVPKKRICS